MLAHRWWGFSWWWSAGELLGLPDVSEDGVPEHPEDHQEQDEDERVCPHGQRRALLLAEDVLDGDVGGVALPAHLEQGVGFGTPEGKGHG